MREITDFNLHSVSLLPNEAVGIRISNIKYREMEKEKIQNFIDTVKITLLNDRVMVVNDDAETKTPGGIILPETAQEKPKLGTVVVTGPGDEDMPMKVCPGQKVAYGKYAGSEMKINGVNVILLRQSDIHFYYDPSEVEIRIEQV